MDNHLLLNNIKYGFCKNHINTTYYTERAATCTDSGFTEGTYCNDCGYWISGHLFIKPLRHTDADNNRVCDVCKETASDIIIGQKTVIVGNGEKDVLMLIPEKSGIFTIEAGGYINEVYIYDVEAKSYVCDYDTWLNDIELEAGKLYRVAGDFDEGYYARGRFLINLVEEITTPDTGDEDIPTTDPDENKPSDKEETDTPEDISCSCGCHKEGFMGMLYKIVIFFWRLFKINPVCSCGVAHY